MTDSVLQETEEDWDEGWPEYQDGLNDHEQYKNATERYLHDCDYSEAQQDMYDAIHILPLLRDGWGWGRLDEEFGGLRNQEYWETLYAMIRLMRHLDYVTSCEGPVENEQL